MIGCAEFMSHAPIMARLLRWQRLVVETPPRTCKPHGQRVGRHEDVVTHSRCPNILIPSQADIVDMHVEQGCCGGDFWIP